MKIMFIVMLLGGAILVQQLRAESIPAAPPRDSIDLADVGPAVSARDMGQQTGRQGIQIDEMNNILNTAESSATVGSNLLTSTSTGMNNVSDNAFGTTSGIATIIQNSGNQNVIQSSFILNLSVK